MAYTSVTVAPEAAADLRLYAAQLGGPLGKRVTMTDALRMAVAVASAHLADSATTDAARSLGLTTAPPTTEGTDQ
jgi:hypothetical protein